MARELSKEWFLKEFRKFWAALSNFPCPADKEAAYYEKLRYQPTDLIKKTFDFFSDPSNSKLDFGEFPTTPQFMARMEKIRRGAVVVRMDGRRCNYCRNGKIYTIHHYDPRYNRTASNSYVYACGFCYPNGADNLPPLDPRDEEKLATRPKEAGGPITIEV